MHLRRTQSLPNLRPTQGVDINPPGSSVVSHGTTAADAAVAADQLFAAPAAPNKRMTAVAEAPPPGAELDRRQLAAGQQAQRDASTLRASQVSGMPLVAADGLQLSTYGWAVEVDSASALRLQGNRFGAAASVGPLAAGVYPNDVHLQGGLRGSDAQVHPLWFVDLQAHQTTFGLAGQRAVGTHGSLGAHLGLRLGGHELLQVQAVDGTGVLVEQLRRRGLALRVGGGLGHLVPGNGAMLWQAAGLGFTRAFSRQAYQIDRRWLTPAELAPFVDALQHTTGALYGSPMQLARAWGWLPPTVAPPSTWAQLAIGDEVTFGHGRGQHGGFGLACLGVVGGYNDSRHQESRLSLRRVGEQSFVVQTSGLSHSMASWSLELPLVAGGHRYAAKAVVETDAFAFDLSVAGAADSLEALLHGTPVAGSAGSLAVLAATGSLASLAAACGAEVLPAGVSRTMWQLSLRPQRRGTSVGASTPWFVPPGWRPDYLAERSSGVELAYLWQDATFSRTTYWQAQAEQQGVGGARAQQAWTASRRQAMALPMDAGARALAHGLAALGATEEETNAHWSQDDYQVGLQLAHAGSWGARRSADELDRLLGTTYKPSALGTSVSGDEPLQWQLQWQLPLSAAQVARLLPAGPGGADSTDVLQRPTTRAGAGPSGPLLAGLAAQLRDGRSTALRAWREAAGSSVTPATRVQHPQAAGLRSRAQAVVLSLQHDLQAANLSLGALGERLGLVSKLGAKVARQAKALRADQLGLTIDPAAVGRQAHELDQVGEQLAGLGRWATLVDDHLDQLWQQSPAAVPWPQRLAAAIQQR